MKFTESSHIAKTDDIQKYRARICHALLTTFALIAVPAVVASLWRIKDIGWQPVMGLHIINATLLWLMVLFRSRIPYPFQAGFIVSMFLIIGLGGLLQLGLLSGAIAFIVVASPVAALLFNGRAGLVVLALSFIGSISRITATTHVYQGRQPEPGYA